MFMGSEGVEGVDDDHDVAVGHEDDAEGDAEGYDYPLG
jgi:hypothetical protein